MKTIFFRSAAVAALGLSLGLAACDKKLDLNPQQSVDAETALNTEQKVTSGVIGMYAKLVNPALYGTNLLLLPELIGGDGYVTWQGTFQSYREVSRRTTLTSVNVEAERTWRRAYEDINQANLVIEALPVVTTPSLADTYRGEALFIRGAMHFELVRLYAQQYRAGGGNSQPGVPITLTPTNNIEQASTQTARASVEQVYAQVITDLTQAIGLLPTDNSNRATRFAAKALLARVYLQQGNYAQALRLSNEVLTETGSSKGLNATLASVFSNRNSAESLFEIQQNDQNNAGTTNDGLATFYASIPGVGRADVQIADGFAALYEDSDVRGTDRLNAAATRKLIYLGNGARPGRLRSGKWRAFSQNIPVLRLGEMYLVRAEANFRLNTTLGALPWADINRIRSRSQADSINSIILRAPGGAPILDPSGKPQLNPNARQITLANILRERQLELAFEGFRIHDLKRTGTDVSASVPITSPRLVLPIPQREINVNSNLTQNESY